MHKQLFYCWWQQGAVLIIFYKLYLGPRTWTGTQPKISCLRRTAESRHGCSTNQLRGDVQGTHFYTSHLTILFLILEILISHLLWSLNSLVRGHFHKCSIMDVGNIFNPSLEKRKEKCLFALFCQDIIHHNLGLHLTYKNSDIQHNNVVNFFLFNNHLNYYSKWL